MSYWQTPDYIESHFDYDPNTYVARREHACPRGCGERFYSSQPVALGWAGPAEQNLTDLGKHLRDMHGEVPR